LESLDEVIELLIGEIAQPGHIEHLRRFNFLLVAHGGHVLRDEDKAGGWVETFEAVVYEELLLQLLGNVIGGGKLWVLLRPLDDGVPVHTDLSRETSEGREVVRDGDVLRLLVLILPSGDRLHDLLVLGNAEEPNDRGAVGRVVLRGSAAWVLSLLVGLDLRHLLECDLDGQRLDRTPDEARQPPRLPSHGCSERVESRFLDLFSAVEFAGHAFRLEHPPETSSVATAESVANGAILVDMSDENDKGEEPSKKKPTESHIDGITGDLRGEPVGKGLRGLRVRRWWDSKGFGFITSEGGEFVGFSGDTPGGQATLPNPDPETEFLLLEAKYANASSMTEASDEAAWTLFTSQLQYLNASITETRQVLAEVLATEKK
jgi:cold shock CspA family protein